MKKPMAQLTIDSVAWLVYHHGPGRKLYVSQPAIDFDRASMAIKSQYPDADYLQSTFDMSHEFIVREPR